MYASRHIWARILDTRKEQEPDMSIIEKNHSCVRDANLSETVR